MLMHPHIAKLVVQHHIDDLRRAAGGPPPVRPADDGALRRPDTRVAPRAARPFARPGRPLEQASEPCA